MQSTERQHVSCTADVVRLPQVVVECRLVTQGHGCNNGISLTLKALLSITLQQTFALLQEEKTATSQTGVGVRRLLRPLPLAERHTAGCHLVALTGSQCAAKQKHGSSDDQRLHKGFLTHTQPKCCRHS